MKRFYFYFTIATKLKGKFEFGNMGSEIPVPSVFIFGLFKGIISSI